MAVLDEDFGTDLTLVEGNGGVRSCPVSVPERAPRDLRSQCERERARADAAEARAEELRWAEVSVRSGRGMGGSTRIFDVEVMPHTGLFFCW